jgi:two-component SAPR family response regulator
MSNFAPPVSEISAPSPLRIQPRPRLFAVMDELCASPILWVGGPPGSGKTALVASYLAARGIASTWFRMGTQSDAAAVTVRAACALQCTSQRGFIIVEDCHQTLSAELSELAAEWASGAHLILIGRAEPPSSLVSLIDKGVIASLPAVELRISVEEMHQWTARLNADASSLTRWHERCHGWALGIARALEAIRRNPEDPMQAFETAKQEVFAYFATEVFEPATPSERQVLVSAALVASASGQMAEALGGNTEAFDVLAQFAGRYGLAARTPGMPPTYQFMPLFREFLLARITDTFSPAELQALAVRATALLNKEPHQDWLGDCDLLNAYFALRRGNRLQCHELLCMALTGAHHPPETSQVCAVFPTAVAQVCAEALRQSIAPESARRLIERHRLPAPPRAGRHWPWAFKVYVLGGFRLLKADAPIRLSKRAQRRPLELLQALIAFGATDVPACALIDALWPDSEGDVGYHTLETALYRLRQLLGAPQAVRMGSSRLSLDRSQFWVDLWEFEHELQSEPNAETSPAERVGRIRELYQGHFLVHENEKPWAVKTRQDLRDRFMRCIRDAALVYQRRNVWEEAVKIYQSGLELDSLSEEFYRGLMVCYRELGDHSEALQAYGRCRELLTRFLGVSPNAKTQAVYHSVRQLAACAQQ